MNNLKNKVQLIGNLGADPEVKQVNDSKTVAKFSLATSKTYKNTKGEMVTDTQWHNIVAWGKTAENVGKFLKKGSKTFVEGELVYRSYKDKNDVKRDVTEIVMSQFLILDSKQEAEAKQKESKSTKEDKK